MRKDRAAPPASRFAETFDAVFLRGWRPFAWLALAIFLIYGQTLAFGLVLLDDNILIGEKLPLLSDWANLPAIFTQGAFLKSGLSAGTDTFYRPVLVLSFMVDAHLKQGSLAVLHLSNMVFHAAAAALVLGLFLKTGQSRGRAFFLALIFAVHPLLAQAVAWAPGRTDSLLAVFVLASFNSFMDLLSEPRWKHGLMHLAFLALALLTKELAVVVPALCVWYIVLFGGGTLSARRKIGLAAGWLALLLGWRVARALALTGGGGYTAAAAAGSVWSNLPEALVYWGKMVLPCGLTTYPILADARLGAGVAALLLAAAALALSKTVAVKRLLWAVGWFFFFLLPSFVYPADSIVPVFFDYRGYLSLIGVLFLLAEVGWVKTAVLEENICLAAGLLVLALGAGAAAHARDYRDSRAYWRSAVAGSPHSAFAHKQLGTVYYLRGALPEAVAEYRTALELNPSEPMARNNLGVIEMGAGHRDEARRLYLGELAVNPNYDDALFNLGLVEYSDGQPARAVRLWERVVEINPDYGDAHRNLAIHCLQGRDFLRAAWHRDEALKRGVPLPPELLRALAPYRR